MKNIASNALTALTLSLLVSYWIPALTVTLPVVHLPQSSLMKLKLSPLPCIAASFGNVSVQTGYLLTQTPTPYPICDPFLDRNQCNLTSPLQEFLKTPAQQNQYLYVRQKLEEYQLPHKLALIPLLESQYNSFVLSSKGAAGMWQLMPGIAKNYGLEDNQRFDTESATTVALSLLKELHQQFGSWELAIAAYNAGSKRVQNALNKNPAAKTVQELSLPIETKKYVSNFNQLQSLVRL